MEIAISDEGRVNRFWEALGRAAIAEQLERHPKRQEIMLTLVSRPWGSMPPPWLVGPPADSLRLEELYQERAAIGEYERGMARDVSQIAAMANTIDTMESEGTWPTWLSRAKYESNRLRLVKRMGF